jgi:NAD(P)H-dependent FMN reductase
MTLKLNVITVSTRPGRVGPSVARWFGDFAAAHGGFAPQAVDLADFALPVYDEPNHPVMQKYEHAHTRKWADSVAAADAYVFVLPEYNYNPPPSFYNALNYVYKEWNYKPAGFVSYGGASGGLRSAQMAKQLVTTLKMMPMMEGVMVPMVGQMLDEQRKFRSNELIDKSATTMLDEMLKWARALKSMRG